MTNTPTSHPPVPDCLQGVAGQGRIAGLHVLPSNIVDICRCSSESKPHKSSARNPPKLGERTLYVYVCYEV